MSPVASYILRDLAIKSKNPKVRAIQFQDAGYKRSSSQISNSTKGFLQTRGFGTTDMMEIKRIDKYWLVQKDLVFVMDKFLQRDIIYDFFPLKAIEMKKKIVILNEVAGIKTRIRDPGEDFTEDITPVFELIERCCIEIMKKIEKEI